MRLGTIVKNEKALDALAIIPLKDAQLAWNLAEAIEKAKPKIKMFNTKMDLLLVKHGVEDTNRPGFYLIGKANEKAFNDEVGKLEGLNVRLDFPKVSIKEFKNVPVSASNMAAWKEMKIVIK